MRNCEYPRDGRLNREHVVGPIGPDRKRRCARCGIVIIDESGELFPGLLDAAKGYPIKLEVDVRP